MEFQYHETLFFLVTWAVGFLASSIRVLCSHQYNKPIDILSIGLSGGFFSFAIIGILLRYDSHSGGSPYFYLALSALIGLMGKEQDLYTRKILAKIFKTIGIDLDKDSE